MRSAIFIIFKVLFGYKSTYKTTNYTDFSLLLSIETISNDS